MTVTAFSGPIIQFGTVFTSTGGTGILGNDIEHNEQRAPMFTDLGDALLDPRVAYAYDPGQGVTTQTYGFFNNVATVDFVPATANTSALVVNTASSGVSTFTLAAASSANGTFLTTIVAPETGKATSPLIAIDSTAAFLTMGSAGSLALWNPAAGAGRNVTIKPSSNGDAGTYSVAGRDMYGFKITETITAGSTNLAGKKAFKYISSVTNTTTPTSTGILVGFGDIFGFPLNVPYVGINAQVWQNSSAATAAVATLSSATVVVALASSITSTSTTADVRGTFASTTASNGALRLQMVISPLATQIATVTSTNVAPLFGVTQFSSV